VPALDAAADPPPVRLTQTTLSNWELCQQWCLSARSACAAWVWSSATRKCQLFREAPWLGKQRETEFRSHKLSKFFRVCKMRYFLSSALHCSIIKYLFSEFDFS
jgi:hypothetical protein